MKKNDIKSDNNTVVKQPATAVEKNAKLIAEKKEKAISIKKLAERKKKEILANANALADRIIDKAIKLEEIAKAWIKRKKEIEDKVAKNLKEQAKNKRERKAAEHKAKYSYISKEDALKKAKEAKEAREKEMYENMHSTIPGNRNKKDEAKAAKEIKTKHDTKMKGIIDKFKDFVVKTKEERLALKRKYQEKAAIAKAHRKDKKELEHHSRAEKIDKAAKEALIRKQNYLAEIRRQESEKQADPQGFKDRQEKRKKSEQERLEMLAERRKKRMEKLQIVELTQKQKVNKDIEHFKKAQEARALHKKAKREAYLTKGGILTPKVKNKVAPRPFEAKPVQKDPELKTYAVVIAHLTDKGTIVDTKPTIVTCKPKNLSKNMIPIHNIQMKEDSNNYVGIFAYHPEDMNHCIYEMIKSDRLTIDGKLTSRMAKQKAEQKAA